MMMATPQFCTTACSTSMTVSSSRLMGAKNEQHWLQTTSLSRPISR